MLPRPIFEGDLYLVTRRVSGRRFFLKPTKKRTAKVEYCIAVAAERHGIQVVAVTVMSNHWHCVVIDPLGRVPKFLQDVHSWIAKVLNATMGRWENFWASAQTSLVRAEGDTNVLDRIIYTMTNPVAAGLVAHGRSWPGLRACWPAKRRPVERPSFFRPDGPMPEDATLELTRPPGFDGMDDALVIQLIRNGIERREHYYRDLLRIQGRRFLGRRAVLAQSAHDTPTSYAERRGMSPRVAEKNKWRRIEALQRLRDFVDRYRRAYAQWKAGFHDVLFPPGTFKLRHTAAVGAAVVVQLAAAADHLGFAQVLVATNPKRRWCGGRPTPLG